MRTVDKNHDTLELPEIYNHIVDYKDLWIIDLSTQIGCPQKCKFCDVSLKTKFVRKHEIVSFRCSKKPPRPRCNRRKRRSAPAAFSKLLADKGYTKFGRIS